MKSIEVPKALQAMTGYECVELYNRPKRDGNADPNVNDLKSWLGAHRSAKESMNNAPVVPVLFQTKQTGPTKLKPNYAYALQSIQADGK